MVTDKAKLSIIALSTTMFVWAIDWTVKLFGHTLPHYTDRSWWGLIFCAFLMALVISFLGTKLSAFAVGLSMGGLLGNIVYLKLYGFTWDMIPVPFATWIYCNVADICIVSGYLILLFEGTRYAIFYRKASNEV